MTRSTTTAALWQRASVLVWTSFLLFFCSSSTTTVVDAEIIQLTSDEFYDMATTQGGGQFNLMIDVRSQAEWNAGHIENATLLAGLQTILGGVSSPAEAQATLVGLGVWNCRSCRVLVYCRSGARAGAALDLLEQYGFEGTLYNGLGVSQWEAAGYELVTDASKDDWACMGAAADFDVNTAISKQASFCNAAVQEEPLKEDEGPMMEILLQELDDNKNLFMAQLASNNATSYSFTFTNGCFCFPADYPWLVTATVQAFMMGMKGDPNTTDPLMLVMTPGSFAVMTHTVTSAINSNGDDVSLPGPNYVSMTYTIMDLFDKIEEAVDRDAFSIQVVYNSMWGYPEEIFIDYDEMMADEEFLTSVSNLTISSNEWEDPQEEDDSNSTASALQMEFDESYGLWATMDLNEYFFQYQWITGMLMEFPWSVHVQDGSVVSVSNANGEDIMMTPGAGRTMEDIFDVVQVGIEQDAYKVDVNYDDTYGYPSDVWVDFDPLVADEEISVTVSYFSTEGLPP